MSKYTIFLSSNEPWGDIWFSKQHFANELALLGHQVFFINAPQKWSFKHLFKPSLQVTKITTNLSVVDYNNPFPLRINKAFFLKLNDYWIGKKLKSLNQAKNPVIWWQFDPFRFVHLYSFLQATRIYHVVDPYQHIWSDIELAKRADLLVLVSQLYEKDYPEFNKKSIYIPHGISKNELLLDNNKLDKIRQELGEGYLIFVGTINPDVDLELLYKIATEIKNQKLVLIGPTNVHPTDEAFLKQVFAHKNVAYLGSKKATELKEYIALASIGIVPYKNKKVQNVHRTPLKLLNYIAQSKPIVTTINYELDNLKNQIIFEAYQHKDFIAALQSILSGQRSINYPLIEAYQTSVLYPKLIKKILQQID